MARGLTFDPASFKGLEYAGWQKGAASYDASWNNHLRVSASKGSALARAS